MGIVSSLLSRPNKWLVRLLGADDTTDSVISFNDAMKITAFRKGVKGIADTVSTLPGMTYTVDSNGKRTPKYGPAYKLLQVQPNQYQNPVQFWSQVIINRVIGTAFVWIEKNSAGVPIALHNLAPEFCTIEEGPNRSISILFDPGTGNAIPYPLNEVLVFNSVTEKGIEGRNVLIDGATVLNAALAFTQHGAKYWTNGAMPKGILSIANTIKDPERLKALRDQFDLSGGKTAVLSDGAKYQAISSTPQESQFVQTSDYFVSEIARLLDMPPAKLYQYLNLSGAGNLEEIDVQFQKDCIRPIVESIESEVKAKLLADNVVYNIDTAQVVRASMEKRTGRLVSLINAGVMTPNEARQEEGLLVIDQDGADVLHFPQNLSPIGDMNNGNINRDE